MRVVSNKSKRLRKMLSIRSQNTRNYRACLYADISSEQQKYGAECVYCKEVYVNKKKQKGYVCKDCIQKTFK